MTKQPSPPRPARPHQMHASQGRPAGVPRLSVEARREESARTHQRVGSAAIADIMNHRMKAAAVAIVVLMLVAVIAFGSLPTRIVVSVMCLGLLQGLWRGASELVGLVAASLLALAVAPGIGRATEGLTASVTGLDGMLNRMVSIGLTALVVIICGTLIVSVFVKRALKNRPTLARWNSLAGGVLGLLEGVILGMGVLWTGLALEPIAASQNDPAEIAESPLARGVRSFADNVRHSALGRVAESTNPVAGTRLLTLASDFVAVTRDEEAMAWLMQTPVMEEIAALPSVTEARDRVHADPQLRILLEDEEVTVGTVRALLESPTVLAIFDQTTVVADLTPRADALVAAIAQAKARIGQPPAGPGSR